MTFRSENASNLTRPTILHYRLFYRDNAHMIPLNYTPPHYHSTKHYTIDIVDYRLDKKAEELGLHRTALVESLLVGSFNKLVNTPIPPTQTEQEELDFPDEDGDRDPEVSINEDEQAIIASLLLWGTVGPSILQAGRQRSPLSTDFHLLYFFKPGNVPTTVL